MEDIEWRVRGKSDLSGKLGSFLVRTNQHVDYQTEECNGKYKAYYVEHCRAFEKLTGKEVAEGIYHEGYYISKSALITDSKPCPLGIVHLTLDSTDCREARSAKEVEYEE